MSNSDPVEMVSPLAGHELLPITKQDGLWVWTCACGIVESGQISEQAARDRHATHVLREYHELEASG